MRECDVECINPVFVDDKGKKLRRIDNLRFLNAFLADVSFKHMTLQEAVPTLVLPDHVIKVEDMEKAYYKLPMARTAIPYQGWRDAQGLFNLFASMCLVFGNGQAPFIFTKTCHPLVRFFGVIKLPCFNYMDDWF